MKTTLKYSSLLLTLIVLFSQCNNTKEKPIEPVQIPGTRVSLKPAEGFILAPEIGGFKHSTSVASIMVLETPKTYKSIVAEISKQKMAESATKLLVKDTVSIEGVKGTLYKTSRLSEGLSFLQWVLVLPVQEHTLTVNGTFLQDDEEALSENIKKSLLSTKLSGDATDTSVLNFTIDADSLILAKILEGPSVMYTRDGTWNDASIFDLSFFAGPSTIYETVEETQEFAIWQLKTVCADCQVIQNGIQPITIDSLKGFEVVALSKDSVSGEIKRLKYEVILFDSSQYYLLVGTSTKNSADRIKLFKSISRSFRKKTTGPGLVLNQFLVAPQLRKMIYCCTW